MRFGKFVCVLLVVSQNIVKGRLSPPHKEQNDFVVLMTERREQLHDRRLQQGGGSDNQQSIVNCNTTKLLGVSIFCETEFKYFIHYLTGLHLTF